jgi:hypothetical protein
VANKNRPGHQDIPRRAGVCLVALVVGINVAVLIDAPALAVGGLVAALAAVADWIRRTAG